MDPYREPETTLHRDSPPMAHLRLSEIVDALAD
jgi:hypothetical protein